MKPKTLRLVLKGEVVEREVAYELPDGSIVELADLVKLVVPSKKNQQRMAVNKTTLKAVPIPSLQHEKWEKDNMKVFQEFANQAILKHNVSLPIARCKVSVYFYFPDSRDRDLSNKFETLADIMVRSGIILDDKFKVMKPVFLDGWVQRDKPRTEIFITIITGDMKEYEWDLTPPEYFDGLRKNRNLKRRARDFKKRQALKAAPPDPA